MCATPERHYNLNRLLLTLIGIWPYQQPHFALIQKTIFFVLFLTFILVQLLVLCTRECNMNLLIQIFAVIFPTLFTMIKYSSFVVEADHVKHLIRQMRADCCLLKDKWELAIVDRYARSGRFVTLILTTIAYFSLVSFVIFQLLPLILDYVSPLNVSRPRQLVVIVEYFVSQEKYFYAIILHETLVFFLGINAMIGILMMLVGYILHSCALFKIASYRIENAVGENVLGVSSAEKKDFLYERMINVIVIHQRAIEFKHFFISVFGRSFLLLIFVGTTSTVINLLQLLQLVTSNDFGKAVIIVLLLFVHFVYMFIINFYGQQLINNGADLFRASYNGMWYAAPLRTQKLLLFVMQKGILSVHLEVGGIFIASLEFFTTLVSSAISYFTVIHSVQ